MFKVVFSFLIMASFLHADRDGGPYLGLGMGVSSFKDDGFFNNIENDRSNSITFYGGAYINKHLSVELVHARFDSWSLDDGYKVINRSNISENINFAATSINTLAHYPFFDDTLDTYLKFGVGEVGLDSLNDNGFLKVFGAGVSFRFSKTMSLKLAYDMYKFEYQHDIDADNFELYNMRINYLYSAVEVQF